MWQQIPAMQGLLHLYYGWVWLARVYELWFTRERSKVRSLVRPPELPIKSDTLIGEHLSATPITKFFLKVALLHVVGKIAGTPKRPTKPSYYCRAIQISSQFGSHLESFFEGKLFQFNVVATNL
jgi:hypothetical protein